MSITYCGVPDYPRITNFPCPNGIRPFYLIMSYRKNTHSYDIGIFCASEAVGDGVSSNICGAASCEIQCRVGDWGGVMGGAISLSAQTSM